jgi:hypothetical protein
VPLLILHRTQSKQLARVCLVLQVWHRPDLSEWRSHDPLLAAAARSPALSSDVLLGTARVSLAALTVGLPQLSGWYNLVDQRGRGAGQVQVEVTPSPTLRNMLAVKSRKLEEMGSGVTHQGTETHSEAHDPAPMVTLSHSNSRSASSQHRTDLSQSSERCDVVMHSQVAPRANSPNNFGRVRHDLNGDVSFSRHTSHDLSDSAPQHQPHHHQADRRLKSEHSSALPVPHPTSQSAILAAVSDLPVYDESSRKWVQPRAASSSQGDDLPHHEHAHARFRRNVVWNDVHPQGRSNTMQADGCERWSDSYVSFPPRLPSATSFTAACAQASSSLVDRSTSGSAYLSPHHSTSDPTSLLAANVSLLSPPMSSCHVHSGRCEVEHNQCHAPVCYDPHHSLSPHVSRDEARHCFPHHSHRHVDRSATPSRHCFNSDLPLVDSAPSPSRLNRYPPAHANMLTMTTLWNASPAPSFNLTLPTTASASPAPVSFDSAWAAAPYACTAPVKSSSDDGHRRLWGVGPTPVHSSASQTDFDGADIKADIDVQLGSHLR